MIIWGTPFYFYTNTNPNVGFAFKLRAANCILFLRDMYLCLLNVKSIDIAQVMPMLPGCRGQAVALEPSDVPGHSFAEGYITRQWRHRIIQIPGSERKQASRIKPRMSGLNSHPTPHPSHRLATMEQWGPGGAAVLSRSSPWPSTLGGT